MTSATRPTPDGTVTDPGLAARSSLAALCRGMAASQPPLVIAGEGNASVALPDGRQFVTPSGSRLAEAAAETMIEIDPARLVAALDEERSDAAWREQVVAAVRRPGQGRPTVEVAMHAAIADVLGACVVAHAHPLRTLAVMCSAQAEQLATARLFPDQIVMLGRTSIYVPYLDPGQTLAREIRRRVRAFTEEQGVAPTAILLGHHGAVTIAQSATAALEAMQMVEKCSEILVAAAALGGHRSMPAEEIDRIAGREDEHYRRSQLASDH